jgi:hypothetical protein
MSWQGSGVHSYTSLSATSTPGAGTAFLLKGKKGFSWQYVASAGTSAISIELQIRMSENMPWETYDTRGSLPDELPSFAGVGTGQMLVYEIRAYLNSITGGTVTADILIG